LLPGHPAQPDHTIKSQGHTIEREHKYPHRGRAKSCAQARRQPRPYSIAKRYQGRAHRNCPSQAIEAG
jgi:hypothetical protein